MNASTKGRRGLVMINVAIGFIIGLGLVVFFVVVKRIWDVFFSRKGDDLF